MRHFLAHRAWRLVALCTLASCARPFRGAPLERAFDPAERSAWIAPDRWGIAGELGARGERAEGTMFLAFPELPADTARALLVITPLDPGIGLVVVIVTRVADGAEIARVEHAGPVPVWIEVPPAGAHELAIRTEPAIPLAAPTFSDPRARPRIELTLDAQ